MIDHSPNGAFQGQWWNDETNNPNEHNKVKNPNWQETDQLAIYKHDRGAELGSTEKQLQLSGQSGAWIRDLWISSPAPQPLGHASSYSLLNQLIAQADYYL